MTSSEGAPSAYVALGDSISIDLYAGGPGRGGASLLARNRDDDFPDWRNRDLATTRPELGFALLATDGATTASVLGVQLPRLASSGAVPRIVTLTVGGNDVLSAYGDTRLALEIVGVVGARVRRVLDRIRGLVPAGDPVIVGTVYDPSDGTSEAWRVELPPWPDVADVLAELNATLKAAAAEHDALVADIHQRFLGHGLQAGNPAQPNACPRDRALWYCNIIEPNAWGADAVRAAFWTALQAHGELAGQGSSCALCGRADLGRGPVGRPSTSGWLSSAAVGERGPIEVRDLRPDEVPQAVGVLARGMRDNPLHVAAYGDDPERRLRCHARLMRGLFRVFRAQQPICAVRDGALVGVTGVAPVGTCRPSATQRLRLLPSLVALGPRTTVRVGRWISIWAKRDPDEAHVHLGPLAVDAHLRGQGIGSLIMQEHCRRLDGSREVGYLETDKPENVRFYERFGFEVIGEQRVLGVPNWFMRRPPQPDARS